ncbi:MAG: peptidylprolyl isomerase [Bacillota bacterium]|uniref:peptidylprolyl isomerase n=1 Tax=Fictibacillus TaxID=1329200 RepID=UPI0018CD6B31|nr:MULTISPECIES: peptidylprolyl isomerase [unclassified Fictibacillus]MBH0157141.1 peptidylprolyl isomerase [Fictibacillus sp. 5RED26]MBH0159462.1 peptidylprolyl isomerase [Fictibacillus sp. 26RED30]MBH0163739.1 peptidylprolyl isomerase [Fictibacillus sp. 7GRE50]MBH0169635.1 peptidylprolyl isomerase [Fictibacillus sp. 18YEL24]MBH0174135.1 peptidylprolyl isomerase [Fictibacillus sp. 23RED33]
MKRWMLSLGLMTGLLALSACSSGEASDSEAIVESNVGEITNEDLYAKLKARYGEQVLSQMVDQMVLEKKYKVTDKEIKKEIEKIKKESGGEDAFKKLLEQNGITDEKALEDRIKTMLVSQKATTDGVKVSAEEMKKAFEEKFKTEVKASHILVDDEKTAQEVKEKLNNGGDFAKLAEEYSKDPGSKMKGGDLGFFGKGAMVPEFDKVAFTIEKNKVSDPIKSNYGYHIIKVTDKRENTFNDKEKEIEEQIKQEKAKPITEIVEKLRKDANVKVNDKELKGILEKKQEQTPQMPQ